MVAKAFCLTLGVGGVFGFLSGYVPLPVAVVFVAVAIFAALQDEDAEDPDRAIGEIDRPRV